MNKGPANKKIIYYFNLTELEEWINTNQIWFITMRIPDGNNRMAIIHI